MPARDIRPSQASGIVEADKLGIPYWLLIRWDINEQKIWTCKRMTPFDIGESIPLHDHEWAAMGSLRDCVEAIVV